MEHTTIMIDSGVRGELIKLNNELNQVPAPRSLGHSRENRRRSYNTTIRLLLGMEVPGMPPVLCANCGEPVGKITEGR